MTQTIHAIYEHGVFRPIKPIDLPEHSEVEFEVRRKDSEAKKPTLDDVYALLGARFDTGEHDVAERHDEHQP